MDLHDVLALHMHGDRMAYEVTLAVRGAYDWHQLHKSPRVLREIWYRVVRKQIPLPHALLTAIHASTTLFSRWSRSSVVHAMHGCAARNCAFQYDFGS